MAILTYVLITPARNEADFIQLTIKSLVAQTVRPLKWVIVSDGSTDGTDDIVRNAAAEHPWIELVQMPERRERNFAGKAYAFSAGYARVKDLDYDIIGNLDGDTSFDPDYFSFLLSKLDENSALGLVGTVYKDSTVLTYNYRFSSIEHVPGICQLFRRQCFEQIGGYMPVKGGAIDTIAVISAKMNGWETRTFPDKIVLHHRKSGRAERGILMAKFKNGAKDYTIGNHPVWELFRMVYQMTRRPFIMPGLMLGVGYFWALIRRVERPVPFELVAFHRRDQMRRLKGLFTGVLSKAT